jgi:hypothetical protein
MAKKKRGRGRPVTGIGLFIGVRCKPEFVAKLDKWRAEQPGAMTRPQALRWLAEIAMRRS